MVSNAFGIVNWLKTIGAVKELSASYQIFEDLTGVIGHAGAAYMGYVNRENPSQDDLAAIPSRNQQEFRKLFYRDALWDMAGSTALCALCFFSLMSQLSEGKIFSHVQFPFAVKILDDAMLISSVLATVFMIGQHFVGLQSFCDQQQ